MNIARLKKNLKDPDEFPYEILSIECDEYEIRRINEMFIEKVCTSKTVKPICKKCSIWPGLQLEL